MIVNTDKHLTNDLKTTLTKKNSLAGTNTGLDLTILVVDHHSKYSSFNNLHITNLTQALITIISKTQETQTSLKVDINNSQRSSTD